MEIEIPENLVVRLKNEDISALGELYDILGKKIYNRCSFILKDDALAADALQDIFMKAFSRIQSIKENSKVEPWLNTICYNHCMDILRARNKHRKQEFEEHHSTDTDSLLESIDLLNESEALKGQLQEVIDDLSEVERMILVMHYWEGLSVQEISEQLDLGLSAVKMKLVRTRDKMKESLNNKGYDHYIELSVFLILFLI